MDLNQLTDGLEELPRTEAARWYRGDGRTVGAFDYESEHPALEMLAFGIQRCRPGDVLELVLADSALLPTVWRSALLDQSVELWRADNGSLERVPPLHPDDAVAAVGGLGAPSAPEDPDELVDLDWPEWLRDFVDWVESRNVERIRRGYWSWHFRGRQVLKVTGKKKFTILAGTDYSKPTKTQPRSFEVKVVPGTEPTEYERQRLRAVVDDAIERRRIALDADHKEHALQSLVGLSPGLVGCVDLWREFPAFRPGAHGTPGGGSIDFLGVDDEGVLQVVETKIGPDKMLGLQGLDYWMWVNHHRQQLSELLGLTAPSPKPTLRYVMGETTKGLIHPAAKATMEVLSKDIDWRCHVIEGWDQLSHHRPLARPESRPGIRPKSVPDS